MRKTLKQALHEVDPHLRVISGGYHRHKTPRREVALNSLDWEASVGVPCPKCGAPEVRFIKGDCRQCYTNRRKKIAKIEASLHPVTQCKDKRLASRVQRYLAKLERKL